MRDTNYPRIVYLDDDKVTLSLIKRLVLKHEISDAIEIFSDESDALEYMIRNVFDILIIDYNLNDNTGLEFLKEARKIQAIDGVILITSDQSNKVMLEALRCRVDDFINKPVEVEVLKISVSRIWKRIQLEWEHKESQLSFERLLSNIPDIVYKIDQDCIIHFVNVAVDQLGFKPEDLIGKHISALIDDEDVRKHTSKYVLDRYRGKVTGDDAAPKLIDERRSGVRMTKDLGVHLKNKDKLPKVKDMGNLFSFGEINVAGYLEKTKSSMKKYSVGIIRDISEHLMREETLINEKKNAIRENLAKSRFLANMSHEIRTPMNGIIGAAQLLRTEVSKEEEKELLDVINNSGTALLTIINDILDFSKLEENKIILEKLPIDLKQIIKDVVYLLGSKANEKKIELSCTFEPEDIPRLIGDPTRIRQVLLNIVSNAIKFTSKGYVKLYIECKKERAGLFDVNIRIVDTGIGIAKENINKIFKSFSQADATTTRKFGGTGLGMAISKQLATSMKGDITVKSELGKGSEFIFYAPMEIAKGECEDSSPAEDLKRDYQKKALLAEDNKINILVAKKILKNLGVDIVVANNGQEAVDLYNQDIDIILMDIDMPIMNGIDATKMLIAKGCETPILAMTANILEDDVEKFYDSGMEGFIGKPINLKDMIDVLDQFLLRS